MIKRPQLAVAYEEGMELTFPAFVSPKYDGIRCTIQNGQPTARSGKLIKNSNIQEFFVGLPEGLDGEFIVGNPTDPDVYGNTQSIVNSNNKPIDDVVFYIFDLMHPDMWYVTRLAVLKSYIANQFQDVSKLSLKLALVEIHQVNSMEELLAFEQLFLDLGYEGLMYRPREAKYKHGRSTKRSMELVKFKRFVDAEAKVVGFVELMHNNNKKEITPLGFTERSSLKANKVGSGMLGSFTVVDEVGRKFEVSAGSMTHTERKDAWDNQDFWLDKLIVFKHFPIGEKDNPRHPVYKGIRDEIDIS